MFIGQLKGDAVPPFHERRHQRAPRREDLVHGVPRNFLVDAPREEGVLEPRLHDRARALQTVQHASRRRLRVVDENLGPERARVRPSADAALRLGVAHDAVEVEGVHRRRARGRGRGRHRRLVALGDGRAGDDARDAAIAASDRGGGGGGGGGGGRARSRRRDGSARGGGRGERGGGHRRDERTRARRRRRRAIDEVAPRPAIPRVNE
eukprot:29515-Pelagococcus_subviridis.AAC.5